MVSTHSVKYPHGITVIGKTTRENPDLQEFSFGIVNGFQIWLQKNYVDNATICKAMALLAVIGTKELWEANTEKFHLEHTFENIMNRIELFENKTIELIIWY